MPNALALFPPLPLAIGLRYLRAKRRNHFISFISGFSVFGIALGVWLLIVVISVMNGFEQELRERILGMASHATITAVDGPLTDWPQVMAQAKRNAEVRGLAPYVEGEGMVRVGSDMSGVQLRGIDPAQEPQVSDIGTKMQVGKLDSLAPGAFNVVIGVDLAQGLGISMGDKVDLMIPQASITPAGILPRFRRFTVSGIFKVGMYEYDRGMVLIDLADAQALLKMDGGVTGVRLKLEDLFRAPQVSRDIAGSLGGIYFVSDWTRSHANFFKAIATEKVMMFLILSMIILVAAFNIVSTMVMVVQEKEADIAILRTMGATPGFIAKVFTVQGTAIGLFGTLLGVASGTLTALNVSSIMPLIEKILGRHALNPEVYYISELPSQVRVGDITTIAVIAFGLSILATLYPAWRASRVQPAEALRYE